MYLKCIYFNVRLALRELSNVIYKIGFSRAFDETVNGDTEKASALNTAVYLLSFFVEIKKKCFYQVQVVMPNSIFLTIVE